MTNIGNEARGQIAFHLNQGSATLPGVSDAALYDIGYGSSDVAAAELDGKGLLDLAVVSRGAAKAGQPGVLTVFLSLSP